MESGYINSNLFENSNVLSSSEEETGSDSSNSLDEYKRNSNSHKNSEEFDLGLFGNEAPCKAANYLLSGSKDEDGHFPHYKTFCKSYRCEYCGPRKVALVRKAIELAIAAFQLRVFASLTLDPKTCQCLPENSAKYIRKVWNKFRTLQKRKFGRSLDFVSVIEFQKNGYAHLHVLFNQYLPHAWVKTKWSAVGGGEIVDVRAADRGAARYLAKYLGKEMLSENHRKLRGYTTSQSISLMKLVKRAHAENGIKYKFLKVSEADGRRILRRYITGDLLDRKNYITGFKATRQLDGSEYNSTLHNVSRLEGGSYEAR